MKCMHLCFGSPIAFLSEFALHWQLALPAMPTSFQFPSSSILNYSRSHLIDKLNFDFMFTVVLCGVMRFHVPV